MKKAIGIGVIVAVVIGVIIVSAVVSMDSVKDTGSNSKEVVLEESIEIEEPEVVLEESIEIEEPEVKEGRDLSVEFTESIGLKGP